MIINRHDHVRTLEFMIMIIIIVSVVVIIIIIVVSIIITVVIVAGSTVECPDKWAIPSLFPADPDELQIRSGCLH